jgi:hypothetical protein
MPRTVLRSSCASTSGDHAAFCLIIFSLRDFGRKFAGVQRRVSSSFLTISEFHR